jgi:ABC-type Zn uptake system ZnuABC Zn-binding protein ZnuA
LLLAALALAGCSTPTPTTSGAATDEHAHESAAGALDALSTLSPVSLGAGEKLRLVATTNIVADVVRQVGGDHIELTALLPIGADPHSYSPTPDDLRALNNAHAIVINGLNLEESMAPILENLDSPIPVMALSNGVPSLALAEEAHVEEDEHETHDHDGADPHTWMNPLNVVIWAENVEHLLSELDPAHAADYAAAAAAYGTALRQLDEEVRAAVVALPEAQRKLVTDHDNLGHFAAAYGFQVVGSVIPSLSTMAAASAQELAALQEQIAAEGVTAIFVGTTVNPDVAAQIAADTGAHVVPIYTDSLSDATGPASTYLEMMRFNVAAIVGGLK